MSHRARAPLAELKEVEERLAVRTARIDQLQAGLKASHERSLRFSRVLVAVASSAALATAMFDLRQSNQLDYLLILTSAFLILVTIVFSLALKRLARKDGRRESALERVLLRWAWNDSAWLAKPVTASSARLTGNLLWVSVPLVLIAPMVLAVRVGLAGSIVLAATALLLAVGLLRGLWSRQLSAPGSVRVIAPLVAVAATFSLGSWAGGRGAELLRIDPLIAEQRIQAANERPRLASVPAGNIPTYQSLCGQREPWSAQPRSDAMARLREAWFTVGAVTAGCPTSIRTADPEGKIVAAAGITDGRTKSVGVADRTHSTLLFGEAAGVAQRLLRSDDLLGVPAHHLVAGGDVYLLDTRQGTVAVTRKATPEELGERKFEGLGSPPGGSFAVLPPAVTSLWLDAMLSNNRWLWPLASDSESKRFVFLSGNTAVARAWCARGAESCTMRTAGSRNLVTTSPRWVSPAELLAFAPGF